MDEIEQTLPKRLKVTFTLSVPVELNSKLEYIKKRTFLTKQQIVLMLCSKAIEEWCTTLMAEEVALRAGAVVPKVDPGVHKVRGVQPNSPPPARFNPPSRPLAPSPTAVNKAIPSHIDNPEFGNKGYGYAQYDYWTAPLGNKKEDK